MNAAGLSNLGRVSELRSRILFTLGMLIVYRLGVHIPVPGIDRDALQQLMASAANSVFGMLDLFSGGGFSQLSIFALGITPYISASIILQLLTVVFPTLEKLQKEGEAGRKKIAQYTRYATIGLALLQSFLVASWLASGSAGATPVVRNVSFGFYFTAILTLTAGTAFIMWLGEQITERGIGNGISLIIFAGIIARLPSALANTWDAWRTGALPLLAILGLFAFALLIIAGIVFFERAQRRIPVDYAKRVVGRRVYGGQRQHLPLKINSAGVIPPIFASSLILFPSTILSLFGNRTDEWGRFGQWLQSLEFALTPGRWLYEILFVAAIFGFAYFYTAIQFNPNDVAENLKKVGGFIPGIRPGKKTAEFIDRVLVRLTLVGAAYLAVISVVPTVLVQQLNAPFFFGGTSLLIVVGVALDTMAQVEAQLISRHYEGFLKKGRVRGRRG
jgi:preprotein translocase subunit SecY